MLNGISFAKNHSGPTYGRRHITNGLSLANPVQPRTRPVIGRSDEDDEARSSFLLHNAVKRVLKSGRNYDQLSALEHRQYLEWTKRMSSDSFAKEFLDLWA